ncbi:MAG TPA: AmmeMemoRadiSam system protein A [Deferrisomatales bacterium]|nr:AmmeMemoRadiSam system protein A [Deferrisomatales bacterium]
MAGPELGQQAQRILLQIARAAIRAGLDGVSYRPPVPDEPALATAAGAFVTLHTAGSLRGCIGTLEGTRPLYQTVAEMARSAAFGDPRFPPLTDQEWGDIRVEISALTPLETIDDPQLVQVGRHGVVISQGGRRGVLLPQVATQYDWDRETFLARTCDKAGLPADAWRRGASIQVFEARVFGEEDRKA